MWKRRRRRGGRQVGKEEIRSYDVEEKEEEEKWERNKEYDKL